MVSFKGLPRTRCDPLNQNMPGHESNSQCRGRAGSLHGERALANGQPGGDQPHTCDRERMQSLECFTEGRFRGFQRIAAHGLELQSGGQCYRISAWLFRVGQIIHEGPCWLQGGTARARLQRRMSECPSLPPPRLDLRRHAFFLDIDGTLLEFACQPDRVRADPALLSLLLQIERRAGGALALVSGRTIASIDQVTAPKRFAAAGIHGFERRNANGAYMQGGRYAALDGPRAALQVLSREHPRLLLEDKGISLALHYRGAPDTDTISGALASMAGLLPKPFRATRSARSSSVELRRGGPKGTAIAAFMEEAPFRGRRPLYAGDDLTDESAFEWVNQPEGECRRRGRQGHRRRRRCPRSAMRGLARGIGR